MKPKKYIKVVEVRFEKRPPSPEAPPFRESLQIFETEEAFVEGEFRTLPQCIHGHPIRTLQEHGGDCIVCGAYLCAECTLHCEIDGDVFCARHARLYGDRIICTRHSILERLLLPPTAPRLPNGGDK